jgi:hypothetical protein
VVILANFNFFILKLHQRNVYNRHLLLFPIDNDSLNPKLDAMCGNNEIGFSCLATNITKVIEVVEAVLPHCAVYRSCYELFRMAFQTPEVHTGNGCYRTLGYIRPLNIWAIQWAFEKKSKKKYGT